MSAEGFKSLINMDGGFTGKRDASGQVIEQGWAGCGFPVEGAATAERTWAQLKGD